MIIMRSNRKVAAIVVLYNPENDFFNNNLHKILEQIDYCILVDNTEQTQINQCNFNMYSDKITYYRFGKNMGIATAQNKGIEIANSLQPEYIVFFDQDSCPPTSLVDTLVNSLVSLEKEGFKVGLIGPRAFNKENKKGYYHKDRDHCNVMSSILSRYTPVDYTLSSGSLVRLDVFSVVGLFKDEFFIDSVDHEICFRMNNHGYHIFIDEQVKLPHMLGSYQTSFLGKNINIPNPIRHYYVFRNWIFLIKLNHVPMNFKLRVMGRILPKALYFTIFEPPRLIRFKHIARGIWHGLINRNGKL